MRVLICILLLASTADAAPKFVVTKWNPGKPVAKKPVKPGTVETPADASDVAPDRSDCGCAGDESNCQCKRGDCRCASCGCKKCGEPAAELSAAAQAKATALEKDGVWWDENFLVEAKKPIYNARPTERRRIHIYAPSWCPACPKTKAALGDGDDDLEVIYHTDERGVQGAKYYPAYWDAEKKQFYYNARLDANGKATKTPWIDNSLDRLKAEMGLSDPVVGSIQAGEIKRELVERVLPILGWWHGAGLKGPARDIPIGPVKLALPENFGVDWTTVSGVTTFTPNAVPRMQWSFLLDKQVNFVKYDGDTIEFDIPRLPNPVLKIIGSKTTESVLPDTPIASPKLQQTARTREVLPPVNQRLPLAATGDYTYPGGRERQNMINHLMQGAHSGHYTRAELEMMDLNALEREHTRDHLRMTQRQATATRRVTVAPRRSWARANCPTGNCPNRG